MEYKQIEAFLAIAEQKNITKAADSLFVSQSALSYRLKSLEDDLGVHLVNRSKGISGVTLSPRGEAFLPIAEEWMQVYQKAMTFKEALNVRLVRIAAPTSVNNVFAPVYNLISEQEPDIRLALHTRNSDAVPSLVSKNEIDIGLGYVCGEQDNIIVRAVDAFPMVIVEKSKGPRQESALDPADLDPRKAVLIKGVGLDNPVTAAFYKQRFGPDMQFHIQVDSADMIISTMPQDGWCMIPRSHTDTFESLDQFHIYDIKEPAPQMPCYLTLRASADKWLREFAEKYFD